MVIMEDVLLLTKPKKGGLLPYFSVVLTLFTLGGVIYLFSSGMDSSAKLTWMFIIAIVPITGVAMLAFTQMNVGNRTLRRRVAELIGGTSDAIKQQDGVLEKLSRDGSGTEDLAAYLNRSGCFPVFNRTQAAEGAWN